MLRFGVGRFVTDGCLKSSSSWFRSYPLWARSTASFVCDFSKGSEHRSYAIIVNKSVHNISQQQTQPAKKSNFAKAQEKLKKEKIQQFGTKSEKDCIHDKKQLEETLQVQKLIALKNQYNQRIEDAKTNGKSLTEKEQAEIEEFHTLFYRKIVQYSHFRAMNMLEGGNTKEHDDGSIGTFYLFTSKLQHQKYLERFESKILKRDYSSVKVSTAPTIAQHLMAILLSTPIENVSAVIDDSLVLSPQELKHVLDWSQTVLTDLTLATLVKALKDLNEMQKELTDIENKLNTTESSSSTKGTQLALKAKYHTIIEEKKKIMQEQLSKVNSLRGKLYVTSKFYIACNEDAEEMVNAPSSSEGTPVSPSTTTTAPHEPITTNNVVEESHTSTVNESTDLEKFTLTKDSKRIVFTYSAPDVAAKDLPTLLKLSNKQDAALAVVSGSELFGNFLAKHLDQIDHLRMAFLGSHHEVLTHHFTRDDIKSIIELGQQAEKHKEQGALSMKEQFEKQEQENLTAAAEHPTPPNVSIYTNVNE
ncbi:hypothetical protein C9374_012171 [Naegleria lovaniensis]|uniref:Uncharacterized protein n=1 Tax=Naegleria lovaniensis TaxID=51637 RepID=A0AA88KI19_NAELO|nr:uncharacterized protein C9374_012171 [Naegleria lovaniensis]KAG2373432.1 hypothetical protein C9374_012171 [Naegleria lovaniensis]